MHIPDLHLVGAGVQAPSMLPLLGSYDEDGSIARRENITDYALDQFRWPTTTTRPSTNGISSSGYVYGLLHHRSAYRERYALDLKRQPAQNPLRSKPPIPGPFPQKDSKGAR